MCFDLNIRSKLEQCPVFDAFFWLGLFLAFWNDFSAIPTPPPGVGGFILII
jgi:hypothetical protein